MTKKIVMTSPADGWFFFVKNKNHRDEYSFYRLAVWATYDNGETLGLLSVLKTGTSYLEQPPENVEGGYIHWDEMNPAHQKEAILQGKIAGTSHPISNS